jgi:hypothetical protein
MILSLSSCITINRYSSTPPETTQAKPTMNNITPEISIEQPLYDERFVQGENIVLSVKRDGIERQNSQIQWTSSNDGKIAEGTYCEVNVLSTGIHQISATDGNSKDTIQIRIYGNLWELYQSEISAAEISRIRSDFIINWIDGNSSDEKWSAPGVYEFNQKSESPSRIIALAKLDVLRHQSFSRPLPFTTGNSAYDNLKKNVKQINLRLDCGMSTAGNNAVNLNRNFSVWDIRQSGSSQNTDACKVPLNQPVELSDYTPSLYLILHEGRHCEPTDPGHVSCNGKSNMDMKLENGSGHATAALYLMWVYKYSLYDSPQTKEYAGLNALSILQNRFCNTPEHSNPIVQSLLNELGIN